MIDNRIKFDEIYINEEENLITLYFTGPKEIIKDFFICDYPEAVSMEISIELPINCIEAKYADVCVSPTKVEEDGSLLDYNWCDISLPYEDIEELISLAEKSNISDEIKASNEYRKGYEQAIKDMNTPMQVIQKNWSPSVCPRCEKDFSDMENCNDGYYNRAYGLERCPYCGQKLEW